MLQYNLCKFSFWRIVMFFTPLKTILICLLMMFGMSSTWAKSFVVSNYPIYLIAEEITQGIEKPVLLLEKQSGHDVQVSPLQRKHIQDASLVLWIGKQHEAPLEKLLAGRKNAIAILDAGIINRLPLRNVRGDAIPNTIDSHVWLEPNHAVRIGFFIAILRGQQNPQYKAQYWANAQKFAKEMFQVSQRYQRTGTAQPYWAYHDAYQYIERVLNLKFAGAMTADAHANPSVAQIKHLNDTRPQKKMCLLAEGHAQPSHYQHLQPVSFQKVDETMLNATRFVDGWRLLAQSIQACLQQTKS